MKREKLEEQSPAYHDYRARYAAFRAVVNPRPVPQHNLMKNHTDFQEEWWKLKN
jgi:predicted secreted hydrolase